MSEQVLVGCSGWNYGDTPDKGGWTGVFYPDKDTKRLRYYSQFFNTAEMDSIRMAIQNNVKLVIDSEAHHSLHFSYLEFGIAQARRGWAKKVDVLNTLPVNKLLDSLK